MSIQKRLRGWVLAGVMTFLTFAAYAETVTLSTYYPSPFGSYQSLTSTGNTSLATAVGTVGIGTPAGAGAKLEVAEPTGATILRLSNGNANAFDFTRSVATGTLSLQGSQVGSNNIALAPTSGNVGIGMNAPGSKLDVTSADNLPTTAIATFGAQNRTQGISAYYDGIGQFANQPLNLKIAGATQATILQNGNVGIGDAAPQVKLDVVGQIRLQDPLNNNRGVLAVSCSANVCTAAYAA